MLATTRTTARIAKSLQLLSQAIKRVSLSEGEVLKLTPVQVQTMLFACHTRPDVASVGYLARSLATTHATAVGVVDGLVRRGYLERRTKPEDRRVTLLALTVEGRAVSDRLDRWNAALADAIGQLGEGQQDCLDDGLTYLVAGMARTGHLVVSEPCPGCVHFVPYAAPSSDDPHYCQMFRRYMNDADTEFDCPKHTPATY